MDQFNENSAAQKGNLPPYDPLLLYPQLLLPFGDLTDEIDHLKQEAEYDPMSQYEMGRYYYTVLYFGNGGEEAAKNAFEYFNGAYEQLCYSNAAYALGICYEGGIGTEKDTQKAFGYFREAADSGHTYAMYKTGCCYFYGQYTEQNENKAFEYFEGAVSDDIAEAKSYLGYCYMNGIGTEQDGGRAFDLFLEAYNSGVAGANVCLGVCYINGIGTDPDEDKAFEFYKEAAEEKNCSAEGMYNLALCYYYGTGTVQDLEKAAEWLEKAAGLGFDLAQDALAELFPDGLETDAVQEKAETAALTDNAQIFVSSDLMLGAMMKKLYDIIAEQKATINTLSDKVDEQNTTINKLSDKVDEQNTTINKLSDKVDDLSAQVAELADKISDITKSLVGLRNDVFKGMSEADISEEKIKEFIDLAARKFNSELQHRETEKAQKYLTEKFKGTWEHLKEDTRISLISSWTMWESCRENSNFDFSGVVICAAAALENELGRLLYYDFWLYAIPDKAAGAIGIEEKDAEKYLLNDLGIRPAPITPQSRIFKNKNRQYILSSRYAAEEFIRKMKNKFDPRAMFVLGDTKALLLNDHNRIFKKEEEKECFANLREEYLGKIMRPDVLTSPEFKYTDSDGKKHNAANYTECFTKAIFESTPGISIIPESGENFDCDPNSLTAKIEYIRSNFRNRAAHKGNIETQAAKQCVDMIFSLDPGTELKVIHSVLMQIHKLLKMTPLSD